MGGKGLEVYIPFLGYSRIVRAGGVELCLRRWLMFRQPVEVIRNNAGGLGYQANKAPDIIKNGWWDGSVVKVLSIQV